MPKKNSSFPPRDISIIIKENLQWLLVVVYRFFQIRLIDKLIEKRFKVHSEVPAVRIKDFDTIVFHGIVWSSCHQAHAKGV